MTKKTKKQLDDEAPWDKAGILTKYSLSFVLPFLRLAWRNELEFEDLPKTPKADLSQTLGQRLERSYQSECELIDDIDAHQEAHSASNNDKLAVNVGEKGQRQQQQRRSRLRTTQPALMRALFKAFGKELLMANLFNTFTRCFIQPLQTIALGWILSDIRRYSNLRLISDIFVDQTSELALANLTRFHSSSQMLDAHQHPEGYLLSLSNETQLANSLNQPAQTVNRPELERDHIMQRILVQLFVLVSCTILTSCLLHPFYFQTYHLGMKLRVAACHMIYKKALRLSQKALSQASAGQMINLLSNDVNRFDRVCESVPFLFDGPCQVIIITFILTKYYVGLLPTLSGLSVIVLMMLFQGFTGKLFSRYRTQTAKRTDERVRLMSEILQAIKVIKMYAWERPFQCQIERTRRQEMCAIRNTIVIRALNHTIFFMSSKIIVAAMLFAYIFLDYGSLDPELIFVTIGLSNLIRLSITLFLANAVASCAEAAISCERIDKFLQLPEIETSPANVLSPTRQHTAAGCLQLKNAPPSEYSIRFERVYAWWNSKDQMVLRNLSLTIKPGQFVLLVGRVGSGKSSVLMSVLGELPLATGRLEINGRLSYASQEAWLFAGTARENILFGEPFELARYQEVVRVCCLERDFKELLADGDQTIVGERGASLSGGQRARINLARALYRQADIYLLDDPLAAVDAPVAKHIVHEALAPPNGFLAGKTVLLATHQLQVLRQTERVLLLDQQAPAMFGTVDEIIKSNKFSLVDYARQEFEEAAKAKLKTMQHKFEVSEENQSNDDQDDEQAGNGVEKPATKFGTIDNTAAPSIENKELDCGVASNAQTYLFYLRNSFQPLVFLWFLLTLALAQGFYVWIDFMLSRWTDAREQLETLGDQIYKPQNFIDRWSLSEMTTFYGFSLVAGLLATLLFCLTFAYGSLRASRLIHKSALARLITAKQSYFDSTPLGIVLNRLSRDLGFVDQVFPLCAFDMILIFSNILVVVGLTIRVNPFNGLIAVGLCTIAFVLRSGSLRAITRLKQIEGITRSPVVSHLSTTLDGLATIRAFGLQRTFNQQFDQHQDDHTASWFAFICTTRWLGQAMDWASITFVSIVMISSVAFQLDSLPASLLGLLLSQSVWMPGALQSGMRQLVESESQMTSVQRLKELSELEVEQQQQHEALSGPTSKRALPARLDVRHLTASNNNKPAELSGCIKFVDVTLRYLAEGEPTLRQLNLLIRPREHIGIVGRTGAGKSSLIGILFRLYEFEGRLELDGRDTRSMALAELRALLGIIPQEPVLFAGSLRHNLDPFERHLDAELWRALEVVRLGSELFARHPEGLEFPISEGGANFSVGQRQLICLARAIVARKKILVLDEATANVDPETDEFIQRTIREHFADCTVLTIAHRLNTIVDSDRVLVLERGLVAEFAEPYELLQDATSLFAQMVASAGPTQATRLHRLFEEAHERSTGELHPR